MASPKQISFIGSLLTDRAVPDDVLASLPIVTDDTPSQDASKVIGLLLAYPKKGQGQVDPAIVPGMYRTQDGEIFKVQKSRESGRMYAKRLIVIGGERLAEYDGETVRGFDFEYDAGAIFRLSASDRMTLEMAQAFGLKFGVCCVCGRFLKDAKSVAAGIGPICGKRV